MEKIIEMIEKLPAENIVVLMWEALDIMQSYNGRPKQECILMAAGATHTEDGGWLLDNETLYQNTKSSTFME